MEGALYNSKHIKSFFDCLTAIRKVSNDFIFCCTSTFLSVRALNYSQTSLPVLIFKESFFNEYMYSSTKNDISFQMDGQCIKFLKKISMPTSFKIIFDPETENPKVSFELIDKYEIIHLFEFFTTEASVFDAVQTNEALLSATISVDELYDMRNAFKCPYIILSYSIDEFEIPSIIFESFNSDDSAKQSFYTLKHSPFCNIKTNNECRIIISYTDFISIIKIAHVTGDHVEIIAGEPGKALTIRASNGASSLKLEASLATLASDDFIASAINSQKSSVANQANKSQRMDSDLDDNAHSISPPESPLRRKSAIKNETQLTESGRVSSSNNSQCSTSTQVVPWKQEDSCEFSASPEFPSKRKHSDITIERSQPTDDDYNDDEEIVEQENHSSHRFF